MPLAEKLTGEGLPVEVVAKLLEFVPGMALAKEGGDWGSPIKEAIDPGGVPEQGQEPAVATGEVIIADAGRGKKDQGLEVVGMGNGIGGGNPTPEGMTDQNQRGEVEGLDPVMQALNLGGDVVGAVGVAGGAESQQVNGERAAAVLEGLYEGIPNLLVGKEAM